MAAGWYEEEELRFGDGDLDRICTAFLWLLIYSFIGWVYETILCSITGRKFVNRGFLNGPVCPIYGFGALLDLALLGNLHGHIVPLFFSAMVVTTTLEYLTSYVMEKLFHARWWDYSKHPFNLNGRVCLLGAVAFGAFSVLLIEVVHPAIAAATARLRPAVLYGVSAAGAVLMLADLVVTVRHLLLLNGRLAQLQAAFEEYRAQTQDRLAELREAAAERGRGYAEEAAAMRARLWERFEHSEWYDHRIRALLERQHFQDRRLLRAFPKLTSTRYAEALERLRTRLREGVKRGQEHDGHEDGQER